MRPAWILIGLWLAVAASAAEPSLAKLERFTLLDVTYVRARDWARLHGGTVAGGRDGKTYLASISGMRLDLTVNSRRAQVNGVEVWLSKPVALSRGSPMIAYLDVTSLLQPLLYPAVNGPRDYVDRICLDAGHGGHDPGHLMGVNAEKRLTLALTKDVAALLRKRGFEVTLTRASDVYIEPASRPDFARRARADLFVSLHYNAAGTSGGNVRGVEVYCLTPEGATSTNAGGEGTTRGFPGNRFDRKNVLLAYKLQQALLQKLGAEDRGVRRARFAVLRTAECPAVLIEGGFLTDRAEAKRILSDRGRRDLAQAIVDGILAYKRMVERGQTRSSKR